MRTLSVLAAAAATGALAMAAACGQQQVISPVTSASTPAPGAPRAGCHGAVPAVAGHTLMLVNSDNGRSFCVTQGATVLLTLRGTAARMWAPIHASSAVLAPRANGRLMLALGVTGAYFMAAHPGSAVLSSARPVCRISVSPAAQPSSPASMPCAAEIAFRVIVIVVGK